jgi:nicotinate-nucleotide adenylyltransferase
MVWPKMTRVFRSGEDTMHPYTRPVERLGVFGGTFDPVHVAHIVVAADTRAALDLDRVLLVVAGDPWQKRGKVVASARDRLMLVEAAVDGVTGVEASAIEVDRGAPSVTADTLEALAGPHRELFLVLGADAVANMSTWLRLDETRELATIVVVERLGDAYAEPPGPGWKVERVSIPRLDVSSTDLRDRLASGRPVDGLIPPAVVHAIDAHGLYTGGR